MLQCVVMCCSAMQCVAVCCSVLHCVVVRARKTCVRVRVCMHAYYCVCAHALHHTATHYNTLQHTATHCNTLQHTATTATYYTMQHTSTHVCCGIHVGGCTPRVQRKRGKKREDQIKERIFIKEGIFCKRDL